MDEKQWSSWVAAEIEGTRAAKAVNEKKYIEYFKSLSRTVMATSKQMSTCVGCPQPDSRRGSVTTANVLGPRRKPIVMKLDTDTLVNQESVTTPYTSEETPSINSNTINSRKRRANKVSHNHDLLQQRKRRLLQSEKYESMTETVAIRIASLTTRAQRSTAKKLWLRQQQQQTQLDMYTPFVRHADRARALASSSIRL